MDFTKSCWYCGHRAMLKLDGYYACEDCGATWNEVPKLGASPIAEEKGNYGETIAYHSRKRRLAGVGKKIRRKKDAVNNWTRGD